MIQVVIDQLCMLLDYVMSVLRGHCCFDFTT